MIKPNQTNKQEPTSQLTNRSANQTNNQPTNQSLTSSMSGFGISDFRVGPLEVDTISSHMNDRLHGRPSPNIRLLALSWSNVKLFLPHIGFKNVDLSSRSKIHCSLLLWIRSLALSKRNTSSNVNVAPLILPKALIGFKNIDTGSWCTVLNHWLGNGNLMKWYQLVQRSTKTNSSTTKLNVDCWNLITAVLC